MSDKVSNKQLQLSDKFFLFDQRVVDKMNSSLFQSLSDRKIDIFLGDIRLSVVNKNWRRVVHCCTRGMMLRLGGDIHGSVF